MKIRLWGKNSMKRFSKLWVVKITCPLYNVCHLKTVSLSFTAAFLSTLNFIWCLTLLKYAYNRTHIKAKLKQNMQNCLLSTSKLVCFGRSGALWLPSHHPGGCCTLVVDDEISQLLCKVLWIIIIIKIIIIIIYLQYICSESEAPPGGILQPKIASKSMWYDGKSRFVWFTTFHYTLSHCHTISLSYFYLHPWLTQTYTSIRLCHFKVISCQAIASHDYFPCPIEGGPWKLPRRVC